MILVFLQPNFAVQTLGVHPERGNKVSPVKRDNLNQYAATTRKRCKKGHKLVSFTNMESHTGFRSVPKSLTLNDLDPYCQQQKYSPGNLVFGNIVA